jgi:3-oxoacyl-[acyl-carrier protein] reductase
MDLPDGTALVTGGSGTVGTAVVGALARGGMDVAVGYHADEDGATAAAAAAREHGVRATAVRGDVTDPDEAAGLVAEAAQLGPLRVVVNGAGVTDPHPIEDLPPESLRRSLAVNVEGAVNVARPAVARLREAGGALVNVSSVAGEIGTVDTSYATAKAGLLGFTRALAREVGADGVRINAVAPGPVESAMNDAILEYLERRRFRGHRTVDSLLDRYEARPAEVADAVRFLAANEFVTGEVLHVDGGMSL